jgi:HEAT repeat protein
LTESNVFNLLPPATTGDPVTYPILSANKLNVQGGKFSFYTSSGISTVSLDAVVAPPEIRNEMHSAQVQKIHFSLNLLHKGFRTQFKEQEVHVRGISPDPRHIENLVNGLNVRRSDGKEVLPKVYCVYIPRLRLDLERTALKSAIVTGAKGAHELPNKTIDLLNNARSNSSKSVFYVKELLAKEDYNEATRSLNIIDEDDFFEQMIQSSPIIFISDWIDGPNVEDYLLSIARHSERLQQALGAHLGQTLAALHNSNLIAGDTHLKQFVVDGDEKGISNVVRVDLVNMYTVSQANAGWSGADNRMIEFHGISEMLTNFPSTRGAFHKSYEAEFHSEMRKGPQRMNGAVLDARRQNLIPQPGVKFQGGGKKKSKLRSRGQKKYDQTYFSPGKKAQTPIRQMRPPITEPQQSENQGASSQGRVAPFFQTVAMLFAMCGSGCLMTIPSKSKKIGPVAPVNIEVPAEHTSVGTFILNELKQAEEAEVAIVSKTEGPLESEPEIEVEPEPEKEIGAEPKPDAEEAPRPVLEFEEESEEVAKMDSQSADDAIPEVDETAEKVNAILAKMKHETSHGYHPYSDLVHSIRRLIQQTGRDAMPYLLPVLNDPNESDLLRATLANLLAEFKYEGALPIISDLLSSENISFKDKTKLLRSFRRFDKPQRAHELLTVIKSVGIDDWTLRWNSAPYRYVYALIDTLESIGLSNSTEGTQNVDALIAHANDENPLMRLVALKVLVHFYEMDQDDWDREMDGSGVSSDEDKQRLLARIKEQLVRFATQDKEPWIRDDALEYLSSNHIDSETIDVLLKAIDDPEEYVRKTALFALADRTESKKVADALVNLLFANPDDADGRHWNNRSYRHDADHDLGVQAARAIYRSKPNRQMTKSLLEGLNTFDFDDPNINPSWNVGEFIDLFVHMGSLATQNLLDLTDSESEPIRYIAIRALSEMEAMADLRKEALKQDLKDSSSRIQKAALRGLLRFNEPEFVREILSSTAADAELQEIALRGLSRFKEPRLVRMILANVPTYRGHNYDLNDALRSFGKEGLQILLDSLAHPDEQIRSAAFDALAHEETLQANDLSELYSALESDDETLRDQAVETWVDIIDSALVRNKRHGARVKAGDTLLNKHGKAFKKIKKKLLERDRNSTLPQSLKWLKKRWVTQIGKKHGETRQTAILKNTRTTTAFLMNI